MAFKKPKISWLAFLFILCALMTVILLVTDYVVTLGNFDTGLSNNDINNQNEKSYGTSLRKRYIVS